MRKLQEWENDGWIFLRVESDLLEQYIDYFNTVDKEKFGLAISVAHGYKLDDLAFLEKVCDCRAVFIQSSIKNIESLYLLKHLEWLAIPELKTTLDFSVLKGLQTLRGEWSSKLKNIECCKNLQVFGLSKFKPKSRNLKFLGDFHRLKKLKLIRPVIDNLCGIEELNKLASIELSYVKSLVSISALVAIKDNLTYLELDHCPNIEDYSVIGKLGELIRLKIISSNSIESLQFIERLNNLELLSFSGTTVQDGDLSPCISLSKLKYIGFTDSKKYTHTNKEIQERLKSRIGTTGVRT